MNTTSRILGEMLDHSGLINGQAAEYLSADKVNELSYTDMLMGMVPSPDSFDFGQRTTNQLRNGAYIFRRGLLDKLASDPSWFQKDTSRSQMARSINGICDEFVDMTNKLSWIVVSDEERKRKNATGFFELQNDQTAKNWYTSEVWQVLSTQIKDLAKQLNPIGAIMYSMKQGKDIEWL